VCTIEPVPASLADPAERASRILRRQVVHGHERAFRGEANRGRLPDARRRPCDQGRLALEAPFHDRSLQC
jgi:hypothetical protein